MLRRALLLSVAFHLLILAGFYRLLPSKLESGGRPVRTLQAKLGITKATPSLLSPALPLTLPRSPSPRVVQHSLPARQGSPRKVPDFPRFTTSTAEAESVPVAPFTMAAPKSFANEETVGKPEISSGSLSQDGLSQYRLNLAKEARRFKRYPTQATQRGWEGTVTIRIEFLNASVVPIISLGKGSGYDMLDAQAMEMMTNAVRTATVPDSLRGRQFVINTPVEYRLDE